MFDPQELSKDTCAELLHAGVVGRIAFTAPSGPQILPVNYSVVDHAILIRTSPYGVLGLHAPGVQAAFEIDQFDHEYAHGWSVVAHGRLEVVAGRDEIAHIQSAWQPRPWAGGATRNLYLRLPWHELTGRRLGTGWDLLGELTVRRTPAFARRSSS